MDRNGMDITEAEDIKKGWQEYTEELYKKIFMTQIITVEGDCSHKIKRCLLPERKAMNKLACKQRHYFADKGPSSQSYGFSGRHVWI